MSVNIRQILKVQSENKLNETYMTNDHCSDHVRTNRRQTTKSNKDERDFIAKVSKNMTDFESITHKMK